MPAKTEKPYTTAKPGTVSKNLTRLREEAEWNRKQLGEASGFPASTIEKMEIVYEPPSNHPYLPRIAKALAKKLDRNAEAVLADLTKGGAEVEFTNNQLARIFQNHRALAPQGFFSNKPVKKPAEKKSAKSGKSATKKAPRNTKYRSLVTFLDTDPRIKTLARKLNLPLPNDKKGPNGKVLGKSPFAIRLRVMKLIDRLKEEGVDIRATMERDEASVPQNNGNGAAVVRRGHRGLGDLRRIVYAGVTTFNQRRTTGEKNMVMDMGDFEIMFADYLKLSGIDRGVLISADIGKLIPKG